MFSPLQFVFFKPADRRLPAIGIQWPPFLANVVQAMPSPQPLSQAEIKHLRTIGHKLNPIVTIAEKGLSEGVASELERALNDHELIKIKLAVADRELKATLIDEVCKAHNATVVQSIGKVALILRRAQKPNPKLSNLLRNIE